MAKPKQPAIVTLSDLAHRYGYSFNAVKSWRAEGLPFDDVKKSCIESEATRWIVENKINPMRNMSVKDEMDREKLREQKAKSDMAEYASFKESGQLISTEQVQSALNQYLTKFKDVIRLIPNEKAVEVMEAAIDQSSTKEKLAEIINHALTEIGDLLISEEMMESIVLPDDSETTDPVPEDDSSDTQEQTSIELEY